MNDAAGGFFLFMREENLVNDNERALLRYVVEGDIRKSQQQAKIVLEGLTTVKDKAFKETCLRTLASKSPTLIELPYNLQGLLIRALSEKTGSSSETARRRSLIKCARRAVLRCGYRRWGFTIRVLFYSWASREPERLSWRGI